MRWSGVEGDGQEHMAWEWSKCEHLWALLFLHTYGRRVCLLSNPCKDSQSVCSISQIWQWGATDMCSLAHRVFWFVGEELPPLKSGKSHIQFWSSNFSCKIRNSGNAGLHLLKMTPKGICVAAFRCKIQRFNRPLLSVYFLPGPYRHLSLRPLISALPRMVR